VEVSSVEAERMGRLRERVGKEGLNKIDMARDVEATRLIHALIAMVGGRVAKENTGT
jgi:hypothetical protein